MEIRGPIGLSRKVGQSRMIVGAVVVAAIVRAVVLLWPGAFAIDLDSYQRVAMNIACRGVFALDSNPTAYRPPLYPLVLSGTILAGGPYWRAAVGVVHWLFGVGTILCVLFIVRDRGPWACILAVFLVAADPILLHHSRLIMTETQSAFLVALTLAVSFHAANRPGKLKWFFGGVLFGLCCLTRPTFLPWPFMGVGLWIVGQLSMRKSPAQSRETCLESGEIEQKKENPRLLPLALVFLGLALTVGPWAIRNWLVLRRPILGTTHGGYTLYLANNPWYYDHLRRPGPKPVWSAGAFNTRWAEVVGNTLGGDEIAADRLAYQKAFETIRSQPMTFLRACLDRLWQLWRVVPHQLDKDETFLRRALRYAVGVFYLFEYGLVVFGITGWIKGCKSGVSGGIVWLLGWALVLTVMGAHIFYWTNMRMRAPLIPILAIWAAEGGQYLFTRGRRARVK